MLFWSSVFWSSSRPVPIWKSFSWGRLRGSKSVRPTKDQYMKLFDSNQRVTDSDGNMCTAVKYLRPLKQSKSKLQMAAEATDGNELDSYRLLHQEKLNYMYSDSGSRHNKLQPRCPGIPVVDSMYDIQVGLCWKQRTKCPKCNYLSPYYECYKTIKQKKPGPDPADINRTVHISTSHTGISCTGVRTLMASLNSPPPSKRQLQRNANKVGDLLIEENERDMTSICDDLKELNTLKGLDPGSPVNVEIDSRYNNPIHSSGSGKTPFQPSTQCTQIVCEQVTSAKKVIHVNNKTKLCQTARMI